ncbi:natural killer cell receptor 2B4 [Phyllostomus hastatus]|uniref:natural killer cell receptor 2B4 n=1 Tax=Phyllostomus hastatus TaxID=9423 RepID=UPI001E68190A|nr:natural killer cell receptor 2B4 [Phyllostomus hastatus]
MREALLEETAAGPAAGPCCCSGAAAPVHTARPRTGRACRPPALPGMLGPALTLALLVLTRCQSQASFEPPTPRLVESGARLQLHVPHSIQTKAVSIKWKVKLRSPPQDFLLLFWKSGPDLLHKKEKCRSNFKNTRCFIMEDQTLVIEEAQPQDSGIYLLEVSDEEGNSKTYHFNVSVLDPVRTPLLQGQQEALDGGVCRVTLSCSISGGGDGSYGDVSYTWYRGSERVLGRGNLFTLEERVDGGPHTYTCQVSNSVSWANQTLRLSHDCLPETGLLPFWVIIVTLAAVLLLGLGAVTWVCVRRRRRKRADPGPAESVTVYEDVNHLRTRSGHEQRQEQRDAPSAETTIYSMILAQPSDFTSQRTENTLYSAVQYSGKPGSKKRKQSPALAATVYDEVGRLHAKARSPVLSRKELENFRVYC